MTNLLQRIWCCFAHSRRWTATAGGDWVHINCPVCAESWAEPR